MDWMTLWVDGKFSNLLLALLYLTTEVFKWMIANDNLLADKQKAKNRVLASKHKKNRGVFKKRKSALVPIRNRPNTSQSKPKHPPSNG